MSNPYFDPFRCYLSVNSLFFRKSVNTFGYPIASEYLILGCKIILLRILSISYSISYSSNCSISWMFSSCMSRFIIRSWLETFGACSCISYISSMLMFLSYIRWLTIWYRFFSFLTKLCSLFLYIYFSFLKIYSSILFSDNYFVIKLSGTNVYFPAFAFTSYTFYFFFCKLYYLYFVFIISLLL